MKKLLVLVITAFGCIGCNLPVGEYVEDAKESYIERLEENGKVSLVNEYLGSTAGSAYATYIGAQNQKENYDNIIGILKEAL